jgi:hypothetical protein
MRKHLHVPQANLYQNQQQQQLLIELNKYHFDSFQMDLL